MNVNEFRECDMKNGIPRWNVSSTSFYGGNMHLEGILKIHLNNEKKNLRKFILEKRINKADFQLFNLNSGKQFKSSCILYAVFHNCSSSTTITVFHDYSWDGCPIVESGAHGGGASEEK